MKIFNKEKYKIGLKNKIFFAFLIIYGITMIYLSYKINISEDETYTLNTTSRNLAGVIKQSYNFEAQPPAYFILFSLWRHLCSGLYFAKLFSLIFTGFACFIFYQLSLLFVTKVKTAYWIAAIFLLNPFTVWAALEIRLYAFLIFLSVFSIYFFFRYYFEEKLKFLYIFLFICIIGLYTQYFFIFLITSLSFIILIFKGWKKFFRFCLCLIPIILLFLPNLQFLPKQISIQESIKGKQYPFLVISEIAHSPQSLILAINLVPNAWINRFIRITFIFSAIYIYYKVYKQHLTQRNIFFEKYNIVLLSILIMLVLFSVGFVITDVGYANKYMVTVFPFFILLFTIFEYYPFVLRRLIYGIILMYYTILLTFNYLHPVKTYDFLSIAKYIKTIEQPNEPILIYRPAIALPFNYYYKGNNKVIPIPYPVKFDSSYIVNIKDSVELKQTIEKIATPSKSYLLISDNTPYEGTVNMNRPMITKYLQTHYFITLDTLFTGWSKYRPLQIRRFEKK